MRLAYEDGQAVLTVADDGVGFDPDQVAGKGLGLSMMRERLHAIAGEMSIDSGRRRKGTVISVHVPAEMTVPPAGQAD